jgi:hypothetical protein
MPHKTKDQRAAYMRQYRARRRKALAPVLPVPQQVAQVDAADVLIAWAETTLIVPSGPLRGESFQISKWQREFLVDALAPGVREAGLSVARKNGKSGLIAALLLGYLCGPLNQSYWRGVVVSLTGALAKELRDQVEQIAEASGLAHLVTMRRSPSPGSVDGLSGSRLTCLASDKATGHGLGADLAIIDEAGLLQENQRDLWGAVLSSVSARDGRLWAISIRGDSPMFSELAARAGQPGVVWHEYAAAEGTALDDEGAAGFPYVCSTSMSSVSMTCTATARHRGHRRIWMSGCWGLRLISLSRDSVASVIPARLSSVLPQRVPIGGVVRIMHWDARALGCT